jgi:hypothetical protein
MSMRRQREQGMSKRGYGSHDCQVQGYACWKQVHGNEAMSYTANDRSFVLLTRDGNGCRVFSAIGRSTLPHKNSFTFFSCSVMEGPCFYFISYFLTQNCFIAVWLRIFFLSFFLFLLSFHSRTFRYKYCTCSYGINNQEFTPKFVSTVCLLTTKFCLDSLLFKLPVSAII